MFVNSRQEQSRAMRTKTESVTYILIVESLIPNEMPYDECLNFSPNPTVSVKIHFIDHHSFALMNHDTCKDFIFHEIMRLNIFPEHKAPDVVQEPQFTSTCVPAVSSCQSN